MDDDERIRVYHVLRQAIATLERLKDAVMDGEGPETVDYWLADGKVEINWPAAPPSQRTDTKGDLNSEP